MKVRQSKMIINVILSIVSSVVLLFILVERKATDAQALIGIAIFTYAYLVFRLETIERILRKKEDQTSEVAKTDAK